MSDALPTMTGYLWENALGVLPLIGLVAVLTKVLPCRPATRHTMWLVCMVWLTLPPVLPNPASVGEFASRVSPTIDQFFSGDVADTCEPAAEDPFALVSGDAPLASLEVAENAELLVGDCDLVTSSGANLDLGVGLVVPNVLPEKLNVTAIPPESPTLRSTASRESRQVAPRSKSPTDAESNRNYNKEKLATSPSNGERAGGLSRRSSTLIDAMPTSTIPVDSISPKVDGAECRVAAHAEPSLEKIAKRKPARRQRTEAERALNEMIAGHESIPVPEGIVVASQSSEDSFALKQGIASVENESAGSRILRLATSWRTELMLGTARLASPYLGLIDGAKQRVVVSWQSIVEWFSKLSGVRDALSRLSSPPSALWLSGTAVLLLVGLARALHFRTRLEIGNAPPDSLRRTVTKVARKIGLRRVPTVVMVKNRVSPMIWCGGRPMLVIPEALWGQLDPAGRHAVVCHELAHLRRYDHVVNWFESIIGCLFWWNPVIWWVRVKLRAEAEDSCDAWVTWLLPEQRRAYAEALLRTKQFVGSGNEPTPVNGIGVTSKHANRLARRIKMVMTESTRPRMSYSGLLLVGMVMLAGWMAVPAQSCPTEEKKAKKDCKDAPAAVVSANGQLIAVTTPAPPTSPMPPLPPMPPMTAMAPSPPAPPAPPTPPAAWAAPAIAEQPLLPGIRSFEQFMPKAGAVAAAGSPRRAPNRDMDERLARLEEQLRHLGERLEHLNAVMDRQRAMGRPGQPSPFDLHDHKDHADHEEDADEDEDEDADEDEDDDDDDEIIARSYSLSRGKLEHLFSLMARQDVPIIVNPDISSGEITVNATEDQHEAFEAFVRLIEPNPVKKEKREPREAPTPRPRTGSRTSDASRERAAEEMARVTEARAVQEEALRAQEVALLEQAKWVAEGARWRDTEAARAQSAVENLMSVIGRAANEKTAQELRHYLTNRKMDPNGLRDHARALEDQAKVIEAESRKLYEQAQTLQLQADELDAKAEELRNKESEDSQKRSQVMDREIEQLREQADSVETQASAMENDSQALFDAAASLLARVDLAGDEM